MIDQTRRWQARGAEVVLLKVDNPTHSPVYGRYVCESNRMAETLAQNLNVQQDNYESMAEKAVTNSERALLAERYYVMTQMPTTWQDWTCGTRDQWIKAYEATLPPEPPVKMVTVSLPEKNCIRTSPHAPHVSSSGRAFCPGIQGRDLSMGRDYVAPYWDHDGA